MTEATEIQDHLLAAQQDHADAAGEEPSLPALGWVSCPRSYDPDLARRLAPHFGPVAVRVLAGRGISDPASMDTSLKSLARIPHGFEDAVAVLLEAVVRQQHVCILGDFDVDGATATALAWRGLKALGLEQVSYLVPSRFAVGRGLTPETSQQLIAQHPDIVLTVDCGITSVDGAELLRAAGIRLIISDHHLPGDDLPVADAVVNPHVSNMATALCGCGVVFHLLAELRAAARTRGLFADGRGPHLASLLSLVALATVADVAPLDQHNRTLVAEGLRRLRAGQAPLGLLALCQVAQLDHRAASAEDLAFALAPRLNAMGRLGEMVEAVRCLITENPEEASMLAGRMDTLNRHRRRIESQMTQQAQGQVSRLRANDALPTGLCLYDPQWHEGVTGIVAARIKDTWQRPVIAMAKTAQGLLKGSMRSMPPWHALEILQSIAGLAPDLMVGFGGHAQAAGLTLEPVHLQAFAAAFDQAARMTSRSEAVISIASDGPLTAHELSNATALALAALEPWGSSLPPPVFEGVFEVVQAERTWRLLRLVVHLPGLPRALEALVFRHAGPVPRAGAAVRLLYGLMPNATSHEAMPRLRVERMEVLP